MSIKEALERPSSPRPTNVVSDWDEDEQRIERFFLSSGIATHLEAGIPYLLAELQEVIKQKFPDVKKENPRSIRERDEEYFLYGGRSVFTGIGWNYQKSKKKGGTTMNTIEVEVQLSTKNLIVHGRQSEIIPASEWKSPEGKTILEDALVDAYRNPGHYLRRPSPPQIGIISS
jgi:hypothetical protein